MATTTHTLAARHYSLPALWHLLSLDASMVAALWLMLAARGASLHLHTVDVMALALGTWMLYVADRVLDARLDAVHQQEERHRFHGANQSAFLIALACAVPVLLVLLTHMEPRLLQAYLLLGAGMAAYFAAIHTRVFAPQVPKELAVGVVFAAAIFMPELLAGERGTLLQAACFGVLCWMNCAVIYQREHTDLREAHWSTRFAVRHAMALLAALAVTAVLLFVANEALRPASVCILLSSLLLAALQRNQQRIGRLNFRVAADAVLLTPLLLLLR